MSAELTHSVRSFWEISAVVGQEIGGCHTERGVLHRLSSLTDHGLSGAFFYYVETPVPSLRLARVVVSSNGKLALEFMTRSEDGEPAVPIPEGSIFAQSLDKGSARFGKTEGMGLGNVVSERFKRFLPKVLELAESSAAIVAPVVSKSFGATETIGLLTLGSDKLTLSDVEPADFFATRLAQIIRLLRESTVDYVTGLPNRRRILEIAEREFVSSRRYKRDLSVLMIDLDRFKDVNDVHGHSAGDKVLKEVARRFLATGRRRVDSVGKYGGEEFLFVLPNTDIKDAGVLAERIRTAVAVQPFKYGQAEDNLTLTVSIGGAAINGHRDLLDLIDDADRALYGAKELGRNKVVMAEDKT